jgi:hypothetical protein
MAKQSDETTKRIQKINTSISFNMQNYEPGLGIFIRANAFALKFFVRVEVVRSRCFCSLPIFHPD